VKPLIGVGGTASGAAEREEALIARLSTLAPALDGEPDPDWHARTRARLVAMAAVRTPEPVSPLRRLISRQEGARSAWRTRLTAGLAGAAAAVTGLATVVALSADAQPGDALYGLKRGTEQGQLALAGDARGRTLLEFASTRLDEVSALVADDASADVIAETLATMDAQTTAGATWLAERAVETGSSASLDDLGSWSAVQSAELEDIRDDVPRDAQDEAAGSAALLDSIEQRVEELRTALDCPAGPATDGTDALGPVPGECATAPAPPATGDPGAPVTDDPGGTAVPTPSAPGQDGVGDGSSGGPGTDGGQLPGSGEPGTPGGEGPGVPTPSQPLPTLPELEVPTLPPGPSGELRPTLGGSTGSTGSTGSADEPTSDGTGATLPRVCLPPLIDC
jgi:hypothetical protein